MIVKINKIEAFSNDYFAATPSKSARKSSMLSTPRSKSRSQSKKDSKINLNRSTNSYLFDNLGQRAKRVLIQIVVLQQQKTKNQSRNKWLSLREIVKEEKLESCNPKFNKFEKDTKNLLPCRSMGITIRLSETNLII